MATEKGATAPEYVLNDKTSDDVPADLKTADRFAKNRDVEIENGHLAELEVDISGVLATAEEEGDWDADTSPFPAVRAVVPETDDPAIPVNTFRAWFLGIVSSRNGEHRTAPLTRIRYSCS